MPSVLGGLRILGRKARSMDSRIRRRHGHGRGRVSRDVSDAQTLKSGITFLSPSASGMDPQHLDLHFSNSRRQGHQTDYRILWHGLTEYRPYSVAAGCSAPREPRISIRRLDRFQGRGGATSSQTLQSLCTGPSR